MAPKFDGNGEKVGGRYSQRCLPANRESIWRSLASDLWISSGTVSSKRST